MIENSRVNQKIIESFNILGIVPTDNYELIKKVYSKKKSDNKDNLHILKDLEIAYLNIINYLDNNVNKIETYTKEDFVNYLKNELNEIPKKEIGKTTLFDIYNNLQNIYLKGASLKEKLAFQIDLYLKSNFLNIIYQDLYYDHLKKEIILSIKEDKFINDYKFTLANDTIVYEYQNDYTREFLTRLLEVISPLMKEYFYYLIKYSKENLIYNRSIKLPYFMLNISSDSLYLQFINNHNCPLKLAISYFLDGNININTNDMMIKKIIESKKYFLLKSILVSKEELPDWLKENISFKMTNYDITEISSELAKRVISKESSDSLLISISEILKTYIFKEEENNQILENLKEEINPFLNDFDRVKKIDFLSDAQKIIITTKQERQIVYDVLDYNKIKADSSSDILPQASKILNNIYDSILSYYNYCKLNIEYSKVEYHLHIMNSLFDLKISKDYFLIYLRNDTCYHITDDSKLEIKYTLKNEFEINTNNKEVQRYITKNINILLKKMYIPFFEIPLWSKKIIKKANK